MLNAVQTQFFYLFLFPAILGHLQPKVSQIIAQPNIIKGSKFEKTQTWTQITVQVLSGLEKDLWSPSAASPALVPAFITVARQQTMWKMLPLSCSDVIIIIF